MTLIDLSTFLPVNGVTNDGNPIASALAVIQAVINGNLDSTNISASAAIPVSAIAGGVASANGWVSMPQTLTYSSADGPTGIVTTGGADLTAVIPVGARLKLTQTTVKYFVVTAIDATTITFYGGTDYTLANAAITLPSYSLAKVPVGFNASPVKWTVLVTDTGNRVQTTPTPSTYYNPNNITISVPIGVWLLDFSCAVYCDGVATGDIDNFLIAGLATANNIAPAGDLLALTRVEATRSGGGSLLFSQIARSKQLTVAAKTSYYLTVTSVNATDEVGFRGGTATTILRAVCAYL